MSENERVKLSILIHCYNNEKTIRSLLENVKWADEVVICDSFSQDKTVEICKEYTDKIYRHEYKNSADQKNWTIPKCSHEWILHVDPDERLTEKLIAEIKEQMMKPNIAYEAYKISFKHYIFRRSMKGAGLYQEYHERLFRKHLRFEEKPLHAHLNLNGAVGILKGQIFHFGWDDMNAVRKRFRRQRKLYLLQKKCEKRKYRLYHLILRPPAIFLYLFIVRKGFIDGWRGIFYAGFVALLEFRTLKDLLIGKK